MSSHPFQLRTLVIGDDPSSWEAAGFHVIGATTRVGNTQITLAGTDHGRGIVRAEVDGLETEIDGMPFVRAADPVDPDGPEPAHTNGVVGFDHLVAMSPDMDRTTAKLLDAGLEHRRTRTFEAGGAMRRQAFFWLGDVILELAGDDNAHGDGPALLWGLAFTCDDLASTADVLGDTLGTVKPAVQRGREIATVRTTDLDISVPIALMSRHPSTEV